MKSKFINFKIEDIIKANLEAQSVQKTLKTKFGLSKFSFDTVFNNRYISNYPKWPEEKRTEFISTIGGRANFNKTKNFIEEKIRN
jgi:hypothetical protein